MITLKEWNNKLNAEQRMKAINFLYGNALTVSKLIELSNEYHHDLDNIHREILKQLKKTKTNNVIVTKEIVL